MAGGNPPGFFGDVVIDGGTLARAQAFPPNPVGLQAKAGQTTGTADALGNQVLSFARDKIGQRVGNGECFDLADQALRNAGAKSAAHFGTVTPNANYVWGRRVSLAETRPGDIIQFRNYRYDRTIKTSTTIDTDFQERPHHTAIVETVDGAGAITVLEQNVPEGDPGQRIQLFFSNGTTTSGGRTTTIKVTGSFWFYRAQPR
ncbi:MAG: CHAP domain-containing protein [Betaproteobacteria bacterium]